MVVSGVLASPAGAARWWQNRTLRRFLRHRMACAGLILIILMALACAFGPLLLPFDDLHIDLRNRFAPPLTGWHILGSDPLGRDTLARLLMAGRISLLVGFFSMLLSIAFGAVIGIIAGYYGGRTGSVLMRIVDAFLSFPSVFLLLALAAFLKPSPMMITVIIAITSWMEVARIVETEVRSLREREFILAAKMLGLSGRWIMFRELLPNVVGPIIVAATLTVARAILLEAYISFLGYGIQPPLPSWGNMLNGAQQYLVRAPWLALAPGLAITLAVTCFNCIGDGLRDALDSRSQQ
ncbi:peptide/nickel transport system permease protein [Erwinia toletana]|uniref:Peptide/nickel transport system permease protein n=1 Tax=Winslowiella toletana TaxID=92490 RepID=A0ABS4P6F7_9GAMM|nr:ABC transporter permease [Winslowiella toletana]MBP2168229.1 peptide/nickel transport system permease protein [Winslowiella toletana]